MILFLTLIGPAEIGMHSSFDILKCGISVVITMWIQYVPRAAKMHYRCHRYLYVNKNVLTEIQTISHVNIQLQLVLSRIYFDVTFHIYVNQHNTKFTPKNIY